MSTTKARLRILIVEDDAVSATFLKMKLTQLGHEVCAEAEKGLEAVVLAEISKPDVILMDFNLSGGMNGVEAIQQIRKKNFIPVIFVTSFTDEATLSKIRASQVQSILIKPVDDAQLKEALDSVLSGPSGK